MSILSGYLLKSQQSNLASSWSKRYVWLTPTTLEYAKSDKQSSKRTVLPLEALTVEAELVQTRRAHVISIKLDAAAAASVRDHEAPSGEEKATRQHDWIARAKTSMVSYSMVTVSYCHWRQRLPEASSSMSTTFDA